MVSWFGYRSVWWKVGLNLHNISANISPHKVETLNICMKDGETFSFDPTTDDIEEYIQDVCEAAKQLGHGDDAVLNLLKATMTTEALMATPVHMTICM